MFAGAEALGVIAAGKTVTGAAGGVCGFIIDCKTAPKSAIELSTVLHQQKRVLETLLEDIGTMSPSDEQIHLIRQTVRFMRKIITDFYAKIAPLIGCTWSRKKLKKMGFQGLTSTIGAAMKNCGARLNWAWSQAISETKLQQLKDGMESLSRIHQSLRYRKSKRKEDSEKDGILVGASTGGVVGGVGTGVYYGTLCGGLIGAIGGAVVGGFLGYAIGWWRG